MSFLDSMKQMLIDLVQNIACTFLDFVIVLLNLIDVPVITFPADSSLWQLIGYMFYISNLSFGLMLIVNAYFIRFVIRRLPVIG